MEFKARQFSRLETQKKNRATTMSNRPFTKKRLSQGVIGTNQRRLSPYIQSWPKMQVIYSNGYSIFYGSIVFSALSQLDKVRSLFQELPEQIEKELAYSVYVCFNSLRANTDKPFRRSLLQWVDLLRYVEDHVKAGESYILSLYKIFNSGVVSIYQTRLAVN